MINIGINSSDVFRSIMNGNITKIRRSRKIKMLKNVVLLLAMIVSMTGPMLINDNLNNQSKSPQTNNSVKSTSAKLSNSGKNLQYTISQQVIANGVNSQSGSNSQTNSQENNNNDNKNAGFSTQNLKTITGTPTSSAKANETASLTYTKSGGVNTANSYTNLINSSSFSYTEPSGYTNTSNTFDVSGITATTGVYNIESGTSTGSISTSDKQNTLRAIASSFTVSQPKVNITQLNMYITASGKPSIIFMITGVLNGAPDLSNIKYTYNISSQVIGSGFGYTPINFPYVTLSQGVYYFLFNDTGINGGPYLTYNYASDLSGDGNQSKVVKITDNDVGVWSNGQNYDLLLQYSYLVLNNSDPTKAFVYSSPSQVNMINNGRKILSSGSNYFNYNNLTMQFTTNVSVNFTVKMYASVKYSLNPFSTSMTYSVINNTFTNWNVSFTDFSFPSSSFSVSNRIFTIYNTNSKWNATKILENSAIYDSYPFAKFSYSNGTNLAINSSTDTSAYTWTAEYKSLNYVSGLTFTTASQNPASYPYKVNSTDLLTVTANMLSGTSGANGTLVLYDYNGNPIYHQSNQNSGSNVISFSSIDLATNISKTAPNGTYTIGVQWLDSSTQSMLGYYEQSFYIIGSTTLQTFSIPNTIVGTNIAVNITYNNAINPSQNLNGATLKYNTSWSSIGGFLSLTGQNTFFTNIGTTGVSQGPHTVLITASLANYVNQTENVTVNIIHNTNLTITPNATSVQYNDAIYFDIRYYDLSSSNANISLASVVMNTSTPTTPVSNYYTFTYNTTSYPLAKSIAFNFSASEQYYLPYSRIITITINKTDTNLNSFSDPANNTAVIKAFAYNSADLLTYTFEYLDTRHNQVILNGTLSTTALASNLKITGNGTNVDVNGVYTVKIDPQKTGLFNVIFSFSKNGYKTAQYNLTFDIRVSNTNLTINGLVNGSSYVWGNNTTPGLIYYNGQKDEFALNLTLIDSNYSQTIVPALYTTVNANATGNYILYIKNSTGRWDITFDPLKSSTFTVSFTLHLAGYLPQTLTFTITVRPIPTSVLGGSLGTTWTNGGTDSKNYNYGQLDNSTFTFIYKDTYWNELINNTILVWSTNGSAGLIISNLTFSNNATWVFLINPKNIGFFYITLTFANSSYVTQIITIYIRVNQSSTSLTVGGKATYPNGTTYNVGWSNGGNFSFIYNNVTKDSFSINLTLYDTGYLQNVVPTGIAGNLTNNAFIAYLVQNNTNGMWYLSINPLKQGNFSLVFTIYSIPVNAYVNQTITLHISILADPTKIVASATIGSTNINNLTNNQYLNATFQEGPLDTITITFIYNDTYYNGGISNALISVNKPAQLLFYNSTTGAVWKINATASGLYILTFTFQKTNYQTSTLTLYINIVKANIRLIDTLGQPYSNTSVNLNSLDMKNFTLYIQNAGYNVTMPYPSIVQGGNMTGLFGFSADTANSYFNLSFNFTNSGTYILTLTISRTSYNNYLIQFTVKVIAIPTAVYDNNGNNIANNTALTPVYYDLGTNDNITLHLAFVDTNKTLLITNSTLNIAPNSNFTVWKNLQSPAFTNWTLEINPGNTGIYYIVLTFSKAHYDTFILYLKIHVYYNSFNVTDSKTGNNWNNATTFNTNYNQNSLDNVTFNITVKDLTYTENLTSVTVSSLSNVNYSISVANQGNGKWKVFVDPLKDGSFIIYVTVTQFGYNQTVFTFTINIAKTHTMAIYGPVSTWTDMTQFNQTFSETNADAIYLNVSSYDLSWNETINSIFTNSTNPTHFKLSYTDVSNGIFELVIDPSSVGFESFTFTLSHVGYDSITITIYLNITSPLLQVQYSVLNSPVNNSTTQNIHFGSNMTILVNVTTSFDNSSISGVSILTNSSYFTVYELGNGHYELVYNRSRVYLSGTENILISFNKTNYIGKNTYWILTVIIPVQPLPTQVTTGNNSTSYSYTWNTTSPSNIIVVNWFDNDTGLRLNTTNTYISYNTTNAVQISILPGSSNGVYQFNVTTTTVGTFFVKIVFSNPALVNYFGNGSIILKIIGLPRTSTYLESIKSGTYNQSIDTFVLYYSTTSSGSIYWYDNITNTSIKIDSATISDSNWVSFSSNNQLFTINGYLVSVKNINITLHSYLYTDFTVHFTIISKLIPTKQVSYVLSDGLAFSNSTTRLGYTLGIDANWVNYNNSQVPNYILFVYKNGTLMNGQFDGLTTSSNQSFNSILQLLLMPNFNYQKGWYAFNLTFTKYGYENQTILILVYIRGFNYHINITYDSQLVQGSSFNIYANVTYDDGSSVNTSQLLLFKITGNQIVNQNITNPVNGLSIEFQINVLYSDGKTGTITGSAFTDKFGKATFTIPGTDTRNIAKINSINGSIANSALADFTQNIVNNPAVEIQKISPLNPLFIIGPVIAVIILFLFGTLYFRRRSKKATKARNILRGHLDKLELVNSVYSIMLTTNTGLPVMTKINAVYSKSKAVEELISGLSVGIDTFLSSFQQDFLNKIGSADQTKVDPNNPQKVFMSAIKRNEFHVLIIGSPSYRGFIFLKDAPNQFAERTFFKIIEQIQANVQIDVVFDEDEVKREVIKQIKSFFPIVLLDKFVINAEKLDEADKKNLISKPSSEILMRLFSITTGSTSIAEKPEKQVAAFNKVLRKNAAFSRASDRMDQIKSGVLFYNTCDGILRNQLKIPAQTIVEALWEANIKGLGIFESIE